MTLPEAQDALDMIQEAREEGLASDISIVRPGTEGHYDPATNKWTPGTGPQTFSTVGLKIGYQQRDIDGTRIMQGDQQVYVPALGFVRPVTGEVLNVGDQPYTIINVDVLAPGDTDILYTLQVRS